MSQPIASSPFRVEAQQLAAGVWWARVDRLLVWAGDRLNPILVKETRQALKSRQFLVTFTLLLIAAWGWSMLGLALMGPEVSYGVSGGAGMFVGYYVVLVIALFVIVPFGAFRSLASEQEERTYELLSITALNPRQIIRGKLGSAVLQMLIYLSVISPCLAFTYMLRGISFPTVLFLILYAVLISLGLSLVGLLAATLTTEKHWQVVSAVFFIAGLIGVCITWLMFALEAIVWHDLPVTDSDFWMANAACLTGYASYFALFFFAAAAQVTFASDNRSTRQRIVMLAQYLLFVGWMAWFWATDKPSYYIEVLLVCLGFAGFHWYAMGAFMTGESADLSLRVRRNLPQSFLGRVFLTWFNPGPGTGYVFSLCGMLGTLLAAWFAVAIWQFSPPPARPFRFVQPETVLTFGFLGLCYMAIYLGIGLLMMRLFRRVTQTGLVLSVLIQIVLVLLGCLIPMIIQWSSSSGYTSGYTLMQITNVFWTLGEVASSRAGFVYGPVLLTVLPAAALVVFVLNLPSVIREVRYVRLPKPKRVAEEDAAQAALVSPPQPRQISPWDMELPPGPGA